MANERRLFRALYVLTGSRDEAEDLAQHAFCRVWERWDRVAALDDPAGYLFRTAFNAHHSATRRAVRAARRVVDVVAHSAAAPAPEPADLAADRDHVDPLAGPAHAPPARGRGADPAPRLRREPRRPHHAHPPRNRPGAREPGTRRAGSPRPSGCGAGSVTDDKDLRSELERLASSVGDPPEHGLERVAARRHRRLRRRRGAVATAAVLAVLTVGLVALAERRDRHDTVTASRGRPARWRARRAAPRGRGAVRSDRHRRPGGVGAPRARRAAHPGRQLAGRAHRPRGRGRRVALGRHRGAARA